MQIFDGFANGYDNWYQTKIGDFIDKVETELAFSLFSVSPCENVLDAGAGTGNFSIKLARVGAEVTGIDVCDDMLRRAEENAAEAKQKITFLKKDIYSTGFADNSFDAVFSMAAFEFIKDYREAFEELYRVVKPGGRILIGTIAKSGAWGKLYQEMAKQGDPVFRHADFKDLDDFLKIHPDEVEASGTCLFIGPGLTEDEYTLENEKMKSNHQVGSYFCVLWKKKGWQ